MSRGPLKKPPATDAATRKRMAAVRREGTRPEFIVRGVLNELGLKYRTNDPSLPGRPDVYLPENCLAILVHGCFWHRHSECKAATMPKSNVDYWEAKFADNVRRDSRVLSQLRERGVRPVVVWQCQTRTPAELRRRLTGFLHDKGFRI